MSSSAERREKSRMLKPGASSAIKENYKEESGGIDPSLLEKRLEGLRDTQESVQGLSLWCQANKRHSSAIIETWLKILKKSPVEKRLTLFYLANDVVQHAKRKNDAMVVNQWAFAVQKATPQVRTPSSVSTAIARIFKIWEERSVYSKETIADLLALLNNVPAKERVGDKKKPETYTASAEKVQAFQTSTLISKVKLAYRLKSHLGVTFRAKPFVHMDLETLKSSIKDRSHGMDVIQEIGQLGEQLKTSETKLSVEVDERRKIVETAEIAIVHYENVRGEAKIVNSAYKNFTERVEATRDKVIDKFKSFEEMEIDISPVPSPPPEAPSPPPDDDDFGLGSGLLQPKSNISNNIRHDIMDALKSSSGSGSGSIAPPSSAAVNNSHHHQGQVQGQGTNSTSSSQHHYDQSQNIPSLAAMQQTFSQNWGSVPTDNFAAMTAMIQQMLPGNNYLALPQHQHQQSSSYNQYQQHDPMASSYHSAAAQGQNQGQVPGPDISSIPLPPPPPEIPLPPPMGEQPQNHNHTNHHQMTTIPSIMSSPPVGQNPYLNAYDTSTTPGGGGGGGVDSNEYVPLPYYKSQQELNSPGITYGGAGLSMPDFDSSPYNSTPSTPLSSQGRYHPYSRHPSETSNSNNSSTGPHNSLVSPAYSNHSGSDRFYGGNTPGNNSNPNISPPAGGPGGEKGFDPMEMFASALGKNKNSPHSSQSSSGQNSQEFLSSGSSMGMLGSGPDCISNSGNPFNTADSFYSPGGIFDGFADDQNQGLANTNGGEEVEPYTPRKPGMGNFFNSRGGGPGRGGRGRGLLTTPRGGGGGGFNPNLTPLGHRGGGGGGGMRGFSPVGGFRGRPPRGPRGGRGLGPRFQV